MYRKIIAIFAAFTLFTFGIHSTPIFADTFFGTLVPMPTPVTLTATSPTLQIGLSTTLIFGGGDGTGGYRFNNFSNGFCEITSAGVVSAIFPGSCSFSLTRIASGKYLDTVSSRLNITALPEPDKSIISAPEPEPIPTPSRSATSAPVAVPQQIVVNPQPASSASPLSQLKKLKSFKITYGLEENTPGYLITWEKDTSAISYSLYLAFEETKLNLSLKEPSAFIPVPRAGIYKFEARSLDKLGRLSPIFLSNLTVPLPKIVVMNTSFDIDDISLLPRNKKTLDNFLKTVSAGTSIKVQATYRKVDKDSLAKAQKIASLTAKYLNEQKLGAKVIQEISESVDITSGIKVTLTGQKFPQVIYLRK